MVRIVERRVGYCYDYNTHQSLTCQCFFVILAQAISSKKTVLDNRIRTLSNMQGLNKTAAELEQTATYTAIGWDFENVWKMYYDADKGVHYPVPVYDVPPFQVTVTVNGDMKTSRGFAWHDEGSDSAGVEVSETNDFTSARTFPATADGPFYKAKAAGLSPGTKYYYRVKYTAGGVDGYSQIGSFVTEPQEAAPFTFLNYSDTELSSISDVRHVAENFANSLSAVPDAAFMLHNGDFTGNGADEALWAVFLNAASSILSKTTLIPEIGRAHV